MSDVKLDNLSQYSDEELDLTPEMQNKLNKLMEFFDNYGISYDKYDPDSITKLDFSKKKAYPNNDHYTHIPGQHDLSKWLNAIKTIKYLENKGVSRVSAIRQSTSGWNPVETFDFLNWLKFHEAGEHMKYKFAQLWYENGAPGYFLHIKPDSKEEQPKNKTQDIDFAISPDPVAIDKKNIIERQRAKIIGRLDSTEKLLRTQEGYMFAGNEYESLIDAIYQLKKKIQMVNKVSSSVRLYEDMIVRQANVLVKNGFNKAADVLFSVAQNVTKMPTATPPEPPAQGSGSVGGLPATSVGAPSTPPDFSNDNSPVQKFLNNLETSKITVKKDLQDADTLEVHDIIDVLDNEDELLVTEAQATPDKAAPAQVSHPLSTTTVEPKKDKSSTILEEANNLNSEFDNKVNQVFSDITITDVVAKLEDLAKIFKTREVPRQLGIVDMMLDSLGLASYFPSLSEATNKALESNNYISTRVEDILSKLRGAMTTRDIDLTGENSIDHPEVTNIKNKLKSDEEKEQARKQMKKEQELEAVDLNKETPDVNIEQDLSSVPVTDSQSQTPQKVAPPPPV